jgi:hypothetical protein
MATRYSGTLVLTIHYVDASESYTVRIRERNDDARFVTLKELRLAPFHQQCLAVESARAYDLVAEAALSFASNDDDAIYNYADKSYGDCLARWHVGRSSKKAFSSKWAVSP